MMRVFMMEVVCFTNVCVFSYIFFSQSINQ